MFRVQTACSVIFLAGGQSSRMGTPKAWLEFAGRPLLVHLVERMLGVFPEVLVVVAPGQSLPETPARVVHDESPGEGPLAGLEVGLREISQPLAFVASCDAPFLDPRIALALVERCDGFDVVVPEWEGRLHPLHAVYRASVQPLVVQQLAEGQRRMMRFLDCVRTRVVTEAELREVEPEGYSFHNMNTPEEYQRALELWNAKHGLGDFTAETQRTQREDNSFGR
jgi:molybdopterin-guanine dinucleotide biosynthesis protein A